MSLPTLMHFLIMAAGFATLVYMLCVGLILPWFLQRNAGKNSIKSALLQQSLTGRNDMMIDLVREYEAHRKIIEARKKFIIQEANREMKTNDDVAKSQ